MDNARFDALTRALTTASSRRGATRLLAGLFSGGALSALIVRGAAAAEHNGGAPCTRGGECKTGVCLNPKSCDCTKATCHCTCSCSASDPQVGCVKPDDPCKKAVCSANGVCQAKPKCADGNPCTRDLCANGNCSHPADTAKNGCSCGKKGGACLDGMCVLPPTCNDTVKNGNETDVDCGGDSSPCANGSACRGQDDCASALCVSRVCQACAVNTDCGIDKHGQCLCETTNGGEKVCASGTEAQVATDCGECGAKYCLPNGPGFICVDRCGAN